MMYKKYIICEQIQHTRQMFHRPMFEQYSILQQMEYSFIISQPKTIFYLY